MRTETQIQIPATKAHAVTKVMVTCDFCDKQIVTRGGYGYAGVCRLCKRDACHTCIQYDPHEPGDRPDNYCPTCFDIKYVRYGDRQAAIDKTAWEAEEALDKSVREESLKEANGKTE